MARMLWPALIVLFTATCFDGALALNNSGSGTVQVAPALAVTRPSHGVQMIDRINGYLLIRPVDARWQTLFDVLADDDSYDNMHAGAVFEIMFGEIWADADIPRREECQSVTWGELKSCFEGDNPDYPGDDNPGDGDPTEPPDEPDTPDGPGSGDG